MWWNVCVCVRPALHRAVMNQSRISVMQPADKFKLWITYQVDIYLDALRLVMHHSFRCQPLSAHNCIIRCIIASLSRKSTRTFARWARNTFVSTRIWRRRGWFSLCRFSRKTEMGDEKRAEAEGSRSGAGGLIRSSVLLCLLWWTLGFNSVAPVCSGIRLLPWQSHTYSHSGGILLILGPANIQKYAHTCTVNGTHDFFYAWGTAELQILSTQCNTQADAHWHTSTVSQYTHLLFIMCKHGEP